MNGRLEDVETMSKSVDFFLSDFTIHFLSKRRRFDFVWQLFQCLEKSGQWSLNHLELDQTQIPTFVLGNYNEIQMIESPNFFEPILQETGEPPRGPYLENWELIFKSCGRRQDRFVSQNWIKNLPETLQKSKCYTKY